MSCSHSYENGTNEVIILLDLCDSTGGLLAALNRVTGLGKSKLQLMYI